MFFCYLFFCFFLTKNLFFFFSLEMSRHNCFKKNADAFEKATSVFNSRRSFVLFFLNVVLNIEEILDKYCFCHNCVVPCLVCQFQIEYLHDEYDISTMNMTFTRIHLTFNFWQIFKITCTKTLKSYC